MSHTATTDEDNVAMDLIKFTPEMLANKTCKAIMETIAEAWCGVWIAQDKKVVLWGANSQMGYTADALQYAKIYYQGTQTIKGIIVTDKETGTSRTYATNVAVAFGRWLRVSTAFISAVSAVMTRVIGYNHTGWQCEKARINPTQLDTPAFTNITFGGVTLSAHSFTIDVDSTGVYFSGGCDSVEDDTWSYSDYTARELTKRVETEKTVGNVRISESTGLKLVFVNENTGTTSTYADTSSGSSSSIEEYGFTVNEGGLIESDGVMSSKKEAESVEIDTDANTVTVTFSDGHTYTYSANVEQSGNTFTLTGEEAEWT